MAHYLWRVGEKLFNWLYQRNRFLFLTKISKKVLLVTPKVVKVLKTPTKKNFTQTSSPASGGNRDVVSDRTTSLMWQNKSDGRIRRWEDSKQYCPTLSLGGFSDWRLTSKDVLANMFKKKHLFDLYLRFSTYWSSTNKL